MRRPLLLYAALGLVLAAVYFLAPAVARTPLYVAVGLVGLAPIVAGIRLYRPPVEVGWWLFAAGTAAFVAGDAVYEILDRPESPSPFPSAADALYLGGYLLLIAGAARILARPRGTVRAGAGVDAALASSAGVFALAVFVVEPTLAADDDLAARLIAAAYPVMDALLLALVVRVLFTARIAEPAHWLLLAGLGALLLTDILYAPLALSGGYASGMWLEAGWMLSYLLVGAAALHPSMASARPEARADRMTITRLGTLAAAMLVAPLTLILETTLGDASLTVEGAALAISLLAVVRVGVLYRRNEELRVRAERSERTFRSLIENSSDVVSILERDGTIRYASPSAERVLGYLPGELERRWAFDLVHPEDREGALAEFAGLVEGAKRLTVVELRFLHADGEWRTLECTGEANLDDEAIGGVVVNSRDLTARKSLEEQLQHSRRLESVGQLAGGIAHDFNNLLTAIGGYAGLALGEADDDVLRRRLGAIFAASDKAASLTQQLLAFSRRQVLQPVVISPNDVIEEARPLLERLIGEHIEVEFALDPATGNVKVDSAQLTQVLVNLAVNARDAMPGGGRLVIETGPASLAGQQSAALGLAAGEYSRLRVSDTGVGMDAATQARVFEPFFTTKPTGEGSGLGLSTVYGIVAQSGGAVRCVAEPGRGATFDVLLPRTTEPVEEPEPEGECPDAGAGRVLVVEDEASVRELVAEMLESGGYVVTSTGDPLEAVELGGERPAWDAVVTDVVMPRMSGIELAERLRALRPGLPVVFTSGYTSHAIDAAARETEFLTKPFRSADLLTAVRNVLERAA